MEAILSYDSDSDENSQSSDNEGNAAADLFSHLKPVDTSNSISKTIALNSTPVVVPTVCKHSQCVIVSQCVRSTFFVRYIY